MGRWVRTIIVTVVLFLVMDLVWLGFIARDFYFEQLGELARRDGDAFAPNWVSGLLVYVLIPAGLLLFVLPRTAGVASKLRQAAWGALYGVILYGVYDLTNHATLKGWSTKLVVADMLWGGVLCGTVTLAMTWAYQRKAVN